MPAPDISVIIPAYNAQAHIQETLESLACQTLPRERFEVIVVDDASTDGTRRLLQTGTKLHNLHLIANERNIGPGLSRNRAIAAARGTLLLFLDADDLLSRRALEVLSRRLHESDADLFVYDWIDYDDFIQGKNPASTIGAYHIPQDREDAVISCLGLRGVDFTNGYKAVRRSLLLDNDIAYSADLHEDIAFTFELYYHARTIEAIDQKLYVRRSGSATRSKSVTLEDIDGLMGAMTKMMDRLVKDIGTQAERYLPHYYAGMRGMCANILKKIAAHVPPSHKPRFYRHLWERILNDTYLSLDTIDNFTYTTEKDRLTRTFIENIRDETPDISRTIEAVEGSIPDEKSL